MTLWQILREIGLDLLALLWPTACVGCDAPDRDLCDACRSSLRTAEREWDTGDPRGHREVRLESGAVIPVFGAGTYESALRAMIVGLKHGGRTGFAKPLGRHLAPPLRHALRRSDSAGHPPRSAPALVCVPSRAAKVRERGYRHVELIVRHALRHLEREQHRATLHAAAGRGPPGDAALDLGSVRNVRALRALRGRTGQVGLSLAERERNAARVTTRRTARLQGRPVILIDDIMTTGATIRGACEALERDGVEVISVVVLGLVARADAAESDATKAVPKAHMSGS